MANIFERMGLVEKVQPDLPSAEYDEVDYAVEEELPEVNTDGVSQENLIEDIYAANGLTDTSRSIFKAEELSNNLPATMPTETKQASVIGILGSFGLTSKELLEDAKKRTDILQAAIAQITEENTDIITAKKQEIEEAKKLIEVCEKTIIDHEKIIADSTEHVEAEVKRITALNEFLGGTK